jgi:SAM-dependent methyltransferase
MRTKPILTGLLSWIPGAYSRFNQGPNPSTPELCYGIGFKHLCLMQAQGAALPRKLAELGPGRSVGTGVLMLLLGAEHYVGLDVVPFAQPGEQVEAWLDSIVALLRRRTALPNADGFPSLRPYLDQAGFPLLMTDDGLRAALDPARIAAVRACLANLQVNRPGRADGLCMEYRVPWENLTRDLHETMDAIFSHTVMQHVPDPGAAYRHMADMLRPGGYTSHQINYGCHGMSGAWNGHWAYPNWLWKLALGRKPFLINRLPHSAHLNLVQQAGLELKAALTSTRTDGLPAQKLAGAFRNLGEDAQIAGAVLIAQKPVSAK